VQRFGEMPFGTASLGATAQQHLNEHHQNSENIARESESEI